VDEGLNGIEGEEMGKLHSSGVESIDQDRDRGMFT
jgi:hypothetical protein